MQSAWDYDIFVMFWFVISNHQLMQHITCSTCVIEQTGYQNMSLPQNMVMGLQMHSAAISEVSLLVPVPSELSQANCFPSSLQQ